jgi:hypothetical protein
MGAIIIKKGINAHIHNPRKDWGDNVSDLIAYIFNF